MKDYNEYELLYMARQNDEEAIALLIEMFRPFALKVYGKIKNNYYGFEFEDAMQYAALGVLSSLQCYRDDMQTSYHSFAMICIDRSIMNYYRKVKRMSQDGYFSYYSVDKMMEDNTNISYGDTLLKDYKTDPQTKVVVKSILEQVYQQLDEKGYDRQVMLLKMKGHSYQEIAETLNISKKDVDNSIQRIRKKIAIAFD